MMFAEAKKAVLRSAVNSYMRGYQDAINGEPPPSNRTCGMYSLGYQSGAHQLRQAEELAEDYAHQFWDAFEIEEEVIDDERTTIMSKTELSLERPTAFDVGQP